MRPEGSFQVYSQTMEPSSPLLRGGWEWEGAGQARLAGLRETGQGMWERCDLGVSRPGVSIAHYPRDFGSHLTSALHSFTAMHRGDRACPPPKGFGTFKWVHAGENPSQLLAHT